MQLALGLLNGVVWGSLFALLAVGLNLVYGILGVVNLAHGSLYMLGAIIGWYILTWSQSFWLSVALAPLVVGGFSLLVNELVIRQVLGRKLEVGVLATLGVAFILDYSVLAVFGGAPVAIVPPVRGAVSVFGLYYPAYRLVVAVIAAAAMVGLWLFLHTTRLGLWMRAVPQSVHLALAVGVPARHVNRVTVVLGGFFAGLAGVLVGPIVSISWNMGLAILVPAFIVVVTGGLGSLFGAVIVGTVLGVSRGLLGMFITPTWSEILSLLILVPILIFKPEGLFGGAK